MRYAMVMVALCACVARGAEPAKAGEFTQHDWAKAELEFNRRTLVEPYKQIGKHDAKWDAEAIAFLEGMCVRFTNGDAGYTYALPGEPAAGKLIELAEAARSKGCDDLMVAYCYAVVLGDTGRMAEATPIFDQVSNELMSSQYPVTRAMNAAGRVYYAAEEARQAEAWNRLRDLMLATISKWEFKGIDRRIIFDLIRSRTDQLPIERFTDLADRVRDLGGADPWLARMIEGHYRIKAAWAARGGGWANTVTEAGWQGFHEHLAKSRASLVRAWELYPEYPESARYMITVAMGAGGQSGEDARTWFDRAIKVQIDDNASYENYRYQLLPRWQGSIPEMQAFADECLKTGRFDTNVPWQYVLTVEAIVKDVQDPAYWNKPGVFEGAQKVCEGYAAKQPADSAAAAYYRTYGAAVAWQTEHFDVARKMLDGVGTRLDEAKAAFMRMRTMPELAIGYAYAMTSPAAELVSKGDGQADAGEIDPAIESYRGALKAAGQDRGAYYVNSRVKVLEWQKAFDKGEWVDVTPADEFFGWERMRGKWRVQDGTVFGTADNNGGMLLEFQGDFLAPRWEVEVTFMVPNGKHQASLGILLGSNDPTDNKGFLLRRGGGPASTGLNQFIPGSPPRAIELHDSDTMKLVQWDDRLRFEVNGQKLFGMKSMGQVLPGPAIYFGLGSPGNPSGTMVGVKSIRIRKATTAPPP